MSCRVEIGLSAQREFASLPGKIQRQLRSRILSLEAGPLPQGAKRLRNTDKYRLRSGSYRIIYRFTPGTQVVYILAIGDRKEVYRNL